MPGEIHWGPLTLEWGLFSGIAALLAGYVLIYWQLSSEINKVWKDSLLALLNNALFVYIIIWKFGAVLSDLSIIWTRPLGLLLYKGGQQEMIYGIIGAAIVLLYSLRKHRISIRVFADIIPWGILGAVIIYQICIWRYQEWDGYAILIAIIVLLGLVLIRTSLLGNGRAFQRFALSFGLGMFYATLFSGNSHDSILTNVQMTYAALVLFGLMAQPLLTFIDRSFLAHPNGGKELDVMEMNNPTELEHEK